MVTKTAEIAVYPVSKLSHQSKPFWLSSLENILELHPVLESPHKHSFYLMLFVESATGRIKIDNQEIKLDGAKLIWINPGRVFSIEINRKAKGYIFGFTENFFTMRYNNNILYQFSFIKNNTDSFIRISDKQARKWNMLLGLMKEEAGSRSSLTENVLRSFVNILLHDFESKMGKSNTFQKTATATEGKLIQFQKHLEQYFATERSPAFYANLLHISLNYLNKICREIRNSTAGELIRTRVIVEAERYLVHTRLSVSEIANQLNFDNPSYFITFFKKQKGSSPEQFRKLFKQ